MVYEDRNYYHHHTATFLALAATTFFILSIAMHTQYADSGSDVRIGAYEYCDPEVGCNRIDVNCNAGGKTIFGDETSASSCDRFNAFRAFQTIGTILAIVGLAMMATSYGKGPYSHGAGAVMLLAGLCGLIGEVIYVSMFSYIGYGYELFLVAWPIALWASTAGHMGGLYARRDATGMSFFLNLAAFVFFILVCATNRIFSAAGVNSNTGSRAYPFEICDDNGCNRIDNNCNAGGIELFSGGRCSSLIATQAFLVMATIMTGLATVAAAINLLKNYVGWAVGFLAFWGGIFGMIAFYVFTKEFTNFGTAFDLGCAGFATSLMSSGMGHFL